MKTTRIAALIFLLLLWLWLCNDIIVGAGGFTFKNIFLIVASGIIIFVPLWKKYIRNGNNNN